MGPSAPRPRADAERRVRTSSGVRLAQAHAMRRRHRDRQQGSDPAPASGTQDTRDPRRDVETRTSKARDGRELRVIHVTTHVALRRVPDLVTRDRVLRVIRLAQRTMDGLGRPRARIAVAGLNPHAGEDGLFGDEEKTEIAPAIEAARAEGLTVIGPLPADTLFSRARGGEFDIVVAMYHDQGHVPVKTLGFIRRGKAGLVPGCPSSTSRRAKFLRFSVERDQRSIGAGMASPITESRWSRSTSRVRCYLRAQIMEDHMTT